MSFSNSNSKQSNLSLGTQNISIDITEQCNMNCRYCFYNSDHEKKVIPTKLAKQIIDNWLKVIPNRNKPKEFTFWGAEPLLEWELLKELVNYINNNKGEQKILIGFITNGILYTKEKLQFCKDNNIQVFISLDGLKECHNYYRSSWDLIIKNLKSAQSTIKNQILLSCLTPKLSKDLFKTIKFYVEDLDLKTFVFTPVYEENWNEWDWKNLEEQCIESIHYILQGKKKGLIKRVKPFDQVLIKTELNLCGAANNSSAWCVDGFNFPCLRFNKHGLGRGDKFNNPAVLGFMRDGKHLPLYTSFKKQFLEYKNKKCKECEIYGTSVCNGGCYAVNYDLTGKINQTVENQCRFKKIQYRINKIYQENI